MKRLTNILLAILVATLALQAQEYRYEIGPALGFSGYLGDANNSNLLRHPGISGGGIFRYNMNSRFAFKGNLLYAGISGNTADIENKYPHDENFKFSSHLVDLGGQVEFNFLNFGAGPRYKNYKRLSPYMTLGVGAVMAFADGDTHFSMVVPLGAGVKFRLKERLNLGFEFTMRKEFSDQIDGLSDLYGIKHGLAKNTDWYGVGIFTITYEFSKRCVKCHYID